MDDNRPLYGSSPCFFFLFPWSEMGQRDLRVEMGGNECIGCWAGTGRALPWGWVASALLGFF